MRKIRLSDTDLELFDMEIAPTEFMFYSKHKDAFRTMWKEQGKPFWTRFVITFRSFTVKHGVIKQMSIDTPKFENLIDQAFIFIHEQFVDGKENTAKNFLEDVARLAQNQDKFPALDSKSFSKDPFYLRDTRELFRRFFGPPDQKSSYLKVYILCPVYMRFGGSVCRCLIKWIDAQEMDASDDSYWTPPQRSIPDRSDHKHCRHELIMCSGCVEDSNTKFFQEKILGDLKGPKFLTIWTRGDPRLNDANNPLFAPHADPTSDWRDDLTIETYKDFYNYCRDKYGSSDSMCRECRQMKENHQKILKACHGSSDKKKRKKKKTKEENKEIQLQQLQQQEKVTKLVVTTASADNILAQRENKKLLVHKDVEQPDEETTKQAIETFEKVSVRLEMFDKRMEEQDKWDESPELSPVSHETTGKELVKVEPKGKAVSEGTEFFKCEAGSETVFSHEAVVSDDYKYGIISAHDIGTKKNLIGGFKVIRIEEEKSGALEITVTVAEVQSDTDIKDKPFLKPLKGMSPVHNLFPLNEDLVKAKIDDLPEKFEWWEGVGWCVSVVNYVAEEGRLSDNYTNFSIKVSGLDEDINKRTMFKLLFYVVKRKRRPCPGWFMDEDDVVTCILPDDTPEYEGVSIAIQKGFRFEERLTEEEKSTVQCKIMITPGLAEMCKAANQAAAREEKAREERERKECERKRNNKVLLTLERGQAAKMLRAEDGRESLKELLNRISGDTNEHEDAQLPMCDGTTLHLTKGAPPIVDVRESTYVKVHGDQENLWDQMIRNPERFELFIMVDSAKAPELIRHGMKKVNMEKFVESQNKNGICKICHKKRSICLCAEILPSSVPKSFVDIVEERLQKNQKKVKTRDIAKRLKALDNPDLGMDISILEQMAEQVPEQLLQRMEYRKKEKELQDRRIIDKIISEKIDSDMKEKEWRAIKEKEIREKVAAQQKQMEEDEQEKEILRMVEEQKRRFEQIEKAERDEALAQLAEALADDIRRRQKEKHELRMKQKEEEKKKAEEKEIHEKLLEEKQLDEALRKEEGKRLEEMDIEERIEERKRREQARKAEEERRLEQERIEKKLEDERKEKERLEEERKEKERLEEERKEKEKLEEELEIEKEGIEKEKGKEDRKLDEEQGRLKEESKIEQERKMEKEKKLEEINEGERKEEKENVVDKEDEAEKLAEEGKVEESMKEVEKKEEKSEADEEERLEEIRKLEENNVNLEEEVRTEEEIKVDEDKRMEEEEEIEEEEKRKQTNEKLEKETLMEDEKTKEEIKAEEEKRLEEERKLEEDRKEDERRKEEERKAYEEKSLERERRIEEKLKLEEEERQEKIRKMEEKKRKEEKRLDEERMMEERRKEKLKEDKKKEEEKRREEERKREENRKQQEKREMERKREEKVREEKRIKEKREKEEEEELDGEKIMAEYRKIMRMKLEEEGKRIEEEKRKQEEKEREENKYKSEEQIRKEKEEKERQRRAEAAQQEHMDKLLMKTLKECMSAESFKGGGMIQIENPMGKGGKKPVVTPFPNSLLKNLCTSPPKSPKKSEPQASPPAEDAKKKSPPADNAKQQLKTCSNCDSVEPTRKAYKKCQKCKDEGVTHVRYYCGRECQVADWNNRHKKEHKDKLLG